MPGRTPYEAVQNFLSPLQRTLSRFTPSVLAVGGGYYAGADHTALLNNGLPVRLAGDLALGLIVSLRYRVIEEPQPGIGPWRVETTGYVYAILDGAGQEMLAYHWHPAAATTWPHLHIGPAAGDLTPPLSTAHLPTGRRVAVEQVLRLAVELGAEPTRDDWEEVLEESLASFEQWRRW